jgi:hypothetical protein
LAECNQEDHCPINKVSSLPATPKGMFNGTMCPTAVAPSSLGTVPEVPSLIYHLSRACTCLVWSKSNLPAPTVMAHEPGKWAE